MWNKSIHIATLTVLALGIPLLGQPNHCTQETVAGTYGLAFEGTVLVPSAASSQPVSMPGVGLSIVSIDSKGAIAAPGYMVIGPKMTFYPAMPGTIQVNSDCTGVVTWVGGGAANAVILGEGHEINTQMFDCGAMGQCVIYGTWRRISRVPSTVEPAQCSAASVFGTYTFRQSGHMLQSQVGLLYPAAVPFATVGMASIAYDGTFSSAGTASTGGQSQPVAMANTKVQIKPDCTGTIAGDITSQGSVVGQSQIWFVILDGGDQLWSLETQDPAGQPVVLGTMTRISPIPAADK